MKKAIILFCLSVSMASANAQESVTDTNGPNGAEQKYEGGYSLNQRTTVIILDNLIYLLEDNTGVSTWSPINITVLGDLLSNIEQGNVKLLKDEYDFYYLQIGGIADPIVRTMSKKDARLFFNSYKELFDRIQQTNKKAFQEVK